MDITIELVRKIGGDYFHHLSIARTISMLGRGTSYALTHRRSMQSTIEFNSDLSIFFFDLIAALIFCAIYVTTKWAMMRTINSHWTLKNRLMFFFYRVSWAIFFFVYGSIWWFWHMFVLFFKNKVVPLQNRTKKMRNKYIDHSTWWRRNT